MSKSRRITLHSSVILDDLLSPGRPASGNEIKMTEKEKIMKFVTLGIIGNGFYFIEERKEDDKYFYTFYSIDKTPPMPLDEKSVREFLLEHETEGYSCTGDWDDMVDELLFLFSYGENDLIELDI